MPLHTLVFFAPKRVNHKRSYALLLFSKLNKTFLDTLIQKKVFKIMKTYNFRGDLTGISAKKEPLVVRYVTGEEFGPVP